MKVTVETNPNRVITLEWRDDTPVGQWHIRSPFWEVFVTDDELKMIVAAAGSAMMAKALTDDGAPDAPTVHRPPDL